MLTADNLSSFIPLISTMTTNKHMLSSSTPHDLNITG